ncbi:MAG: FAD-dependent oxidoreductase [Myxococcaceae bacterium]
MRSGNRPRVVVVGAGPAALSAGIHLLEEAGGELEVELVSMGHQFGGKAASWRDPDGYVIDHGFHAVFGFYEEMKSLLKRAGVNLKTALVPAKGLFRFFDERTGTLEQFKFAHNPLVMLGRYARFPGLSFRERMGLSAATARMAQTMASTSLESLDDLCYSAFLLQHGTPRSVLDHPMMREVYELAFNHPFEISTYIVLRWAELSGHCFYDATFDYIAGSWSEQCWDPLARYFGRLGGTVRLRQKLERLETSGSRLTALHFATPDQGRHHVAGAPWPGAVPVDPGSARRDDRFDAVICAIPAACFVELNPGGELWNDRYFGDMRNLTSVSTLSLQVWLKDPTPGGIGDSIAALPLPLGYLVDYKPLVPEFQQDGRYGAALEWVGGDVGYESVPDEELIRNARRALAQVPGFEGTDAKAPVHLSLRRNRANHQRYLLTDPGTLRFRPRVRSPVQGLFLAGDWVRNEVEGPSMEGAIRSGKAAARAVLESL